MLLKYHIATSLIILLFISGCYAQKALVKTIVYNVGGDSAKAEVLTPKMPPQYYVDQGVKYFWTMQTGVPTKIGPHYSDLVIRWEWHPWLLLTGYKRINLINSDILLKLYSTKYDTVNCRFFEKEPFCRCHVIFNYSGYRYPIYEEFTFNNKGEITFIEAWSDYPSLLPMNKKDYWAEADSVKRLSAKLPGLGNAEGRINYKATWMLNAANNDTTIADLLQRIRHPIITYCKELRKQKQAMINAIRPPKGDVFPYYP